MKSDSFRIEGISNGDLEQPIVMAGFIPAIHVLRNRDAVKTWMAWTMASEATPLFERLCPD